VPTTSKEFSISKEGEGEETTTEEGQAQNRRAVVRTLQNLLPECRVAEAGA